MVSVSPIMMNGTMPLSFLLCTILLLVVPGGEGVSEPPCGSVADCNRVGECISGVCHCDPGWTGERCQLLDLVVQASPSSGAAWNSHNSSNSSWCITAPRTENDVLGFSTEPSSANATFHIFVSQMVPGCGLETWLPGSRIVHATSSHGIEGPYEWKQQVFSSFHHNPHLTRASDGTWLLYFNGREWPEDDFNMHTCKQNRTCPSESGYWEHDYWHGGGSCDTSKDCVLAGGSDIKRMPFDVFALLKKSSQCLDGTCICEHHWFGEHCGKRVETVNLAYSSSLDGPWTQLLPDGAAFFDDGATSLGLSNPAAWPLANGTVVLAYSRAPSLGIAVAPHWKGPYTRWHLITSSGEKNYSLINPNGMFNNTSERNGEDPFIYQDRRGMWHVIFHGYGGDGRLTDGQAAHSSDLLHWTWQPQPVYSSTVHFQNGESEQFARRERPALVLNGSGIPLFLLNGVMPSHPGSDHTYSYIHATSAAKMND